MPSSVLLGDVPAYQERRSSWCRVEERGKRRKIWWEKNQQEWVFGFCRSGINLWRDHAGKIIWDYPCSGPEGVSCKCMGLGVGVGFTLEDRESLSKTLSWMSFQILTASQPHLASLWLGQQDAMICVFTVFPEQEKTLRDLLSLSWAHGMRGQNRGRGKVLRTKKKKKKREKIT